MDRRLFLKHLGFCLAANAIGIPLTSGPSGAPAQDESSATTFKVAFLADAHLPDGKPDSIAARHLALAVEEINGQEPPVDLVFFGGDLTHDGNPKALSLAKEFFSSLRPPVWLLPGEKDYPIASGSLWTEIFGRSTFSFIHKGVHFIGLNTVHFGQKAGSGLFQISHPQHHWLAAELAETPCELPLIIVSHAPLYRLFHPWQWWTEGAETVHDLLQARQRVILLHGHVHQHIGLEHKNLQFLGVRSTAWPLPDVRLGVPQKQREATASDRTGCGWLLLTISSDGAIKGHDCLWEG
ncbi:MAG TPA: hypothetical protein DCY27_14355 [Desulfobacterales bacterium]|nr:hypothetical protein [Desulfobacterales bacterium]